MCSSSSLTITDDEEEFRCLERGSSAAGLRRKTCCTGCILMSRGKLSLYVSRLERVVCVAGGWARVRLMGRCVAGKLGGLGRVWWQSWQVLAGYLRHWCGRAVVWEAVGGTSVPERTGPVRR